ncbi:MAG: ShlB/FhaC/HecB family hemolysin secretion/activation protein [Pseudomonadota bacterium]|nr:ShlB/FhaC/HecB family hemolysin secretion/activation protein [Pseudomonadota bacterium]
MIWRGTFFFLLAEAILAVGSTWAADPPGPDIQRRQAIQLEQNQIRQQTDANILSNDPAPTDATQVVIEETPCFTLSAIEWRAAESFPWLIEKAASFKGQCLGAVSLKRLRNHLTLALLSRGYITSRVIFPQQNLASGVLAIELLSGRVGKIENIGQPIGITWFPLAASVGDLLNQRDLDQTLENFRRLPSQANTRFDLIPGAALGESDVQLIHGQGGRLRGNLALDDGGGKNTGKHQLSGSVSIDSPLGLYDSLALTYNTNADARNPALGSRASSAQWNIPLGYASLFSSANRSSYKQTVAGFNAPIRYTGNSTAFDVGATLTTYRSGSVKGQSQFKLFRKVSRNYIDDTEISVQARDLVGAEISHTHKHLVGDWTLTVSGTLRASLPAQSKNIGVIVGVPDWDGRYRLGIANLAAGRGFKAWDRNWRYQTQLRWQHTHTALPPTEYVSIGGRHSVRGFDGEQTLSAESGGVWRNEIGLVLQALPGNHETYLALDAGRIAGTQSAALPQKHLVGAALGLRGSWRRMNYDLSLGAPLAKPDTLTTAHPTAAAFISFDFNF